MTPKEFRKTYLWGNTGLYKNDFRVKYRYYRSIQLLLNLDEIYWFLNANERFDLRLSQKSLNLHDTKPGIFNRISILNGLLALRKAGLNECTIPRSRNESTIWKNHPDRSRCW